MKIRINALLTFCLTFTFFNPIFAQWTNAELDTVSQNQAPDFIFPKHAIAIDAFDNLHLVWMTQADNGNSVSYNRRSKAGDWGGTIPLSLSGNAAEPVLAVSPATARPMVAYLRGAGAQTELMLTFFEGTNWENIQITNNDYPEFSPSIVADESGTVHLAWIGEPQPDVFKIFYARVQLSTQTFDVEELTGSALGAFGSGAAPYLAFSEVTGPVIAYRGGDFQNYHVYLAQKMPGAADWTYEVVLTPNLEDFTAALALRGLEIHALISGNDGFGIGGAAYYLVKNADGDWSDPEKVTLNGTGEAAPALILDEQGHAHCVWEGLSGNILTGNIFYSNNVSGAWKSEPLLAFGNMHHPGFTLDRFGKGYLFAEMEDIINYDITQQEVVLYGEKSIASGVFETPKPDFSVEVFPNPAVGEIWVQMPETLTSGALFRLYNAAGMLVFEQAFSGGSRLRLPRQTLPAGTYFYRVSTPKNGFGAGKLRLR